jgi:hypothetical protein
MRLGGLLMEKLDLLEKSIESILKKILPPLRSKKDIRLEDFEVLFGYLDELAFLLRGKDMLPRSVAYKLYHLQFEVGKQFSYIQDDKVKGNIQARVHTKILAVLNDSFSDQR